MTIQTGLTILGASVRAAAQSAVHAEIETYCIDLFGDEDTKALGPMHRIERYPVEFLSALAQAPQSPWMYTGSLENYPQLISRLAKIRPLLGNNAEVLKRVRDPRWLAETLRDTGVSFPTTREAVEHAPPLERCLTPECWLVKRKRSGGGMGIRRLGETLGAPISRQRIVQRFVAGLPFSASFLATEDQTELIGVAGQWLGYDHGAPEPFQYAGSYAPIELNLAELTSLQLAAQKLVRESGLRGLFGIDLIRNDEGLHLIEVNPRYTASMELHERLLGRALIAEHCAAFAKNRQSKFVWREPPEPPRKIAAKRIVYADQAGVIGEHTQVYLQTMRNGSAMVAADLSPLGTEFRRGAPICTLLTSATNLTEAELSFHQAAAQIRQSLDPPLAPS